jgi:hypothetical protein
VAFDLEAFRREWDKAQEIAEAVRCPLVVRAVVRIQAGREILVGRCPCGTVAALSGEGKHLCRLCWRWLRYVREG